MSVARRSLQVLAFVCTLIVGVASMAVIVTQTTWFKEWLRGFIVRQSRDYLNGQLSIGHLGGNLFFGVDLEDVDIAMNGKNVVDVKNVGLDYNAFTFIKGDVVLDSIKIERPILRLEQNAHGQWNLTQLVKAQTPDKPKSNRSLEIGEIGVADGTLYVDANDGAVGTSGVEIPSRIDRVDASVGIKSNARELAVDINHVSLRAANPRFGVNALSGVIRKSDTEIDFRNVALRTEETSLSANGTVKNLDAKVPVIDVKVSSDKFSVDELSRIVPALRGYKLEPQFQVTATGPADKLGVKLDAQERSVGRIAADATIDAIHQTRRVAGTASVQNLNVGPVAKNPALKTDVTGRAKVDLSIPPNVQQMRGTFNIDVPHIAAAGYEARNVIADGRIDGQTVAFNGKADAYGGSATAAGTVKTGQPLTVDVKGHAAHLDLRTLPPALNAPGVASNLQFDYTVSGRAPQFSGTLRLAPSMLAGAAIEGGTRASFTVGNGAPTYSAEGGVADLDLQQIGRGFGVKPLADDRYRSRLNASFTVKGSGGGKYPLGVDAKATLINSELFGATFPRFEVSANIAQGDAHVVANGQFANLDPAVASGNRKVAGKVSGDMAVDATVRNYAAGITPDSVAATAHVNLTDSNVSGLQIDSAVVDGQFANREGRIDQLAIMGPDLTVTGQGPIALNDTGMSNVELHLQTPAVDRIGRLVGQDDLTGGALVDAWVNGNADNLYLTGTLTGSNLGKGDNNALSLITNFEVTVPKLDAQQAQVHANTTANFVQVGGQKINYLNVDTTYQQSKVDFLATAQQQERELTAGGSVILHPDHQEIHLPDLSLRSQSVVWRTAEGSEAAVQYGSGRVDVKNLQLVNGDQHITADGVFGAAGQSLKVQVQNVDVAQLNQLALGQPGQVQGRLTANATIGGTMQAPQADADFTLAQGAFQKFTFDSFGGKVNYTPHGVNLDVRLQQNPTQWLTAKGFAPTSLFKSNPPDIDGHQPPPAGESFDIQVASSPIDLGIIQGFTSSVANVTGTMQANFKVTGSGYDPHLDGAIEVHNGALEIPDLGTSYTGIDTRIDLTPDAVKVTEMKIVDNHGSAMTIGGQLAVHERSVGGVDVSLKSHDFKVIDNKMGNVRINTDLHLTGEVRYPRLEGSIGIETGQIDIAELLQQFGDKAYATSDTKLPTEDSGEAAAQVRRNAEIPGNADTRKPNGGADTAPATTAVAKQEDVNRPANVPEGPQPSAFEALAMNVEFTVPDDLVIKGQDIKAPGGATSFGDANITVGGDLYISKVPYDVMRLTGDVRTIRGFYTFQGRRFEIQRDGRIRFIGSDQIDPSLDITAERTIQGVQTFIDVKGSMSKPELSFRSSPPLEQADILALIIFNQPVNQLGEGQQASLAQRAGDLATGYLASGLARSIGNALNLNEFEIQAQGENGAGPSVTLGQQIGKNLYFRLQQGFGATNATQFILEYQLAEFLRLRATAAETSGGTQRIQFQRVERGGLDLIFFFAY
jgi:autotransporter translocation and assembly factor TamB